jgi:hypothetical protein
MDIISAYREVGSYRSAAQITGTTPKTVKRVIDRHEAGVARRSGREPGMCEPETSPRRLTPPDRSRDHLTRSSGLDMSK